jgi:hypothetical protein
MAFDGNLLNRPSGPERSISTALEFEYSGVYVQPAVAVVSPDGDGVGDRQTLRYKLVRPSTVVVKLTAPDGKLAYQEAVTKQPGSYAVAFPPVASPPVTPPPTTPPPTTTTPTPPPTTTTSPTTTTPAPPTTTTTATTTTTTPTPPPTAPSARSTASARATPEQGTWKLTVSATDDIGQPSEMSQTFLVNSTVGFLGTDPKKLFLPPFGRDLRIRWKQTKAASVVVTGTASTARRKPSRAAGTSFASSRRTRSGRWISTVSYACRGLSVRSAE